MAFMLTFKGPFSLLFAYEDLSYHCFAFVGPVFFVGPFQKPTL